MKLFGFEMLKILFQDENVGEHKIRRKLDGRREIVYSIPANVVIKPGKNLTVSYFYHCFRKKCVAM